MIAPLSGLLISLVLLLLVVAMRAARSPAPPNALPPPDAFRPEPGAAARLAGAVAIPTISRGPGDGSDEALRSLHRYLETCFPRTHQTLTRETVNTGSLLFTWSGPSPDLPPLLLLGHLDVVPVPEGTEDRWTHPPFAGVVAGGRIWGRGALDFKAGVLAQLEAVESLLLEGFRPRRTVHLAYGHDEEVGGAEGAQAIAELLWRRGVRPFLALDEGQAVLHDLVPGVKPPVAAVGVAEKGHLNLELDVRVSGGHSSTPPPDTAASLLARALTRLAARPMPSRLSGPTRRMLAELAPHARWPTRLFLANLWLFGSLVRRRLAATPGGNALVRTTAVPTILHSGLKENVLPDRASAVVNVRVLPGDSPEVVLRHVRAVVGDTGVEVRVRAAVIEPTAESPADGEAFSLLGKTARQIFPEAVVVPSLVLGTTDARHYGRLTPCVYRFAPFPVTPGDLERYHGVDESVLVGDYEEAIRFYRQLLLNGGT